MNILDKASINISDNSGNLKDIDEIAYELSKVYYEFECGAMSDYALFKQGQKDMLWQVISYLEKL